MKKLLSAFLALILVMGLLPAAVLGVSADDAYSGSCGADVFWSLDPDTGVLTISGTGPMDDYYSDHLQPWRTQRDKIAAVVIEPGVSQISRRAFTGCSKLRSVSLSEGLKSIGDFAFCKTDLTGTLSLPASLETIGEGPFDQCPNLQRFSVAAGNRSYSNDASGVLFDRAKTVLIRCPQTLSGDYTVPPGVVTIANSAFDECADLTAVALPDGLQHIGYTAFRLCSSLTVLAFPATLDAESVYSFYGCTSLERYEVDANNPYFASDASGLLYNKTMTKLLRCPEHYCGACTLPEGVASCDSSAFHDCVHVTSLYLPASFSVEGNNWQFIFFHLLALQTITVADGNPCVASRNGVLYSKDMKQLLGCPAGFVGVCEVADETTVIQINAFLHCSQLEAVKLPTGLEEIEEFAFFGCRSMKRIAIPAGVTAIGDMALGYYDPTFNNELKGMSLERVRGFAIFGYRDTSAYAYAEEERFDFYDLAEYEEGKTEFTDVSPDAWYAQPVHWAFQQGIVSGTGGGRFSPGKACTRAEIITMLWRAKGSPEPVTTELPFQDVRPDAWYAKAVAWAVEKGITVGTSQTTFSPHKTCTRAEAITFLWKAVVSYDNPLIPAASFQDVSPDAWYAKAVAWAVWYEITAGTSKTTFSPKQVCTRAQVVTFFWAVKQGYNSYFGKS